MTPRTAPDPGQLGVGPQAIEELRHFGGMQRYKARISQVAVFWQETASLIGLPSRWTHREVVVREVPPHGEWRTYAQKVSGIWMGFAESIDGKALKLLLLVPREETSERAAVEQTRRRV